MNSSSCNADFALVTDCHELIRNEFLDLGGVGIKHPTRGIRQLSFSPDREALQLLSELNGLGESRTAGGCDPLLGRLQCRTKLRAASSPSAANGFHSLESSAR